MHNWMARMRGAFRGVVVVAAFAATPVVVGQTMTPPPSLPPPPPPTPIIMPLPTVVPITPMPRFCTPDKMEACPPAPILAPTPTVLPTPPIAPTLTAPSTALTPSGGSSIAAGIGTQKVLSYFQRGVTHIDTQRAFGLVLIPRSAVTAEDKKTQTLFCLNMLATLAFVAPDAAARRDALVTYWPIVATRDAFEIQDAFQAGDCDHLIAWYDHNAARTVAAKAGIERMSGPLLITWPAAGGANTKRDPLIVDFARADNARARKALDYWFSALRDEPTDWKSRIREGTFRAGVADAINDTAGVVIAVLSGKWESFTALGQTP